MKKALIILSVFLLAAEAMALVPVRQHQRGYRTGDSSRRITDGAMHDYVPKKPESVGETPEGVDAL